VEKRKGRNPLPFIKETEMKINLKYAWFGPDGIYRNAGVHDLPEDLYSQLPRTTTIVDEKVKVIEVPQKPKTLKDFDEERANSDAFSAILNKKGK